MNDNPIDIHVFWVSLACISVVLAIEHGQQVQLEKERVCHQVLDDGRRLITHKIGPLGHEKCTYQAPQRYIKGVKP